MLKIDKVYNNNVVQASNTEGEELIVMGRGLGFQKKPETFSTLIESKRPLFYRIISSWQILSKFLMPCRMMRYN